MRKFIGIAALLVVMGCQTEGIPDSERPDGVLEETSSAELTCPGGAVVHGMAGPTCAKPTPDAGKVCTKASDCTGHCMADTMTCSTVTPQLGCFEMLTEEGDKVGLCVD